MREFLPEAVLLRKKDELYYLIVKVPVFQSDIVIDSHEKDANGENPLNVKIFTGSDGSDGSDVIKKIMFYRYEIIKFDGYNHKANNTKFIISVLDKQWQGDSDWEDYVKKKKRVLGEDAENDVSPIEADA